MNKTHKRKLAELALIFGIPIITGAKEASRLAGLQRKLQKLVLPDLGQIPGVTNKDIVFIDNQVEAWFKKVGWWRNPQQVSTLISFAMDVIEESPFKYNPRIIKTLEDIAVHLDNKGEFIKYTMNERDTLLNSWTAIYA